MKKIECHLPFSSKIKFYKINVLICDPSIGQTSVCQWQVFFYLDPSSDQILESESQPAIKMTNVLLKAKPCCYYGIYLGIQSFGAVR
jgi:hypothetical protein